MIRKKEWWEKNWPERLVTIVVGFFYGLWFIISRTIYGIFRLFEKLATDVFKTVYGKVVAALAVIIFTGLLASLAGLISH